MIPAKHSIRRRYHAECAHFLPMVPEGHKCKRLHGHNYEFEIVVAGELDRTGWVLDFWDLDRAIQPIVESIDHRLLNEIEGLENPTAEIIAVWLLGKIDQALSFRKIEGNNPYFRVVEVSVYETKDAVATARVIA